MEALALGFAFGLLLTASVVTMYGGKWSRRKVRAFRAPVMSAQADGWEAEGEEWKMEAGQPDVPEPETPQKARDRQWLGLLTGRSVGCPRCDAINQEREKINARRKILNVERAKAQVPPLAMLEPLPKAFVLVPNPRLGAAL